MSSPTTKSDTQRREWVSAHIFYHADQDNLLSGAVRPLVEGLLARGKIERSFFIRYWQGGPHIRLRLLPAAGTGAADIRATLAHAVGEFLSSNPSEIQIREEDYLRVANPLSQVEPGQRGIDPLQPDNSIRYVPYGPEYERYGGTDQSIEVVERHFAESSAIALDVIAPGGSRERRAGQALAMMFVAASVACDGEMGRLKSFLDVGGDVWGRRLTLGSLDRREVRIEESFQRQRERLLDLVSGLNEMVRRGEVDDEDSPVSRWLDSVLTLKSRLSCLEREGQFISQSRVSSGDPDQRVVFGGIDGVLLLCSHMNNNRLGISLTEEAYLMFLLGRSVSEIVGGGESHDWDGTEQSLEGRQ